MERDHRRAFLKAAAAAAGYTLAAPLEALARRAGDGAAVTDDGYGPLTPAMD